MTVDLLMMDVPTPPPHAEWRRDDVPPPRGAARRRNIRARNRKFLRAWYSGYRRGLSLCAPPGLETMDVVTRNASVEETGNELHYAPPTPPKTATDTQTIVTVEGEATRWFPPMTAPERTTLDTPPTHVVSQDDINFIMQSRTSWKLKKYSFRDGEREYEKSRLAGEEDERLCTPPDLLSKHLTHLPFPHPPPRDNETPHAPPLPQDNGMRHAPSTPTLGLPMGNELHHAPPPHLASRGMRCTTHHRHHHRPPTPNPVIGCVLGTTPRVASRLSGMDMLHGKRGAAIS